MNLKNKSLNNKVKIVMIKKLNKTLTKNWVKGTTQVRNQKDKDKIKMTMQIEILLKDSSKENSKIMRTHKK